MPKQSLNMRKIYVGNLITSVLVGFYLFEISLHTIPQQVLMWVAFIPFYFLCLDWWFLTR